MPPWRTHAESVMLNPAAERGWWCWGRHWDGFVFIIVEDVKTKKWWGGHPLRFEKRFYSPVDEKLNTDSYVVMKYEGFRREPNP